MSVGSSTGSETTDSRSRRTRFREWRHRRPFAGGILLMLAGLLIAWVPLQFAFELLLVGGSYTYIGLLWAISVFLTGAFVLYRPEFSTIFGVLGVILSILSLLGALGGLLIGMIVGIIGGNLCVAWSRPDAVSDSGGGPGDDRRPVRTDGGSPRSGADPGDADDAGEPARVADPHTPVAGAGPLSRLSGDRLRSLRGALGGSSRRNYLERLRRLLRGAARGSGESLRRAKSPAAPARLVDAATAGGSKRLAVTVAVLVVASGTLTLVSAVPAAAFLGDQEESSYTVDVGEIRLGEGGQICAAQVGDDTYRVTITDATLVDTTIYQQQGDGTVKTEFPTLHVREAMVMYTTGDDENIELLASTAGCTEENQTSRTVFRAHEGATERLHSPEGVTMLNLEATGATVPQPGGFQFAAPGNDSEASPVPNVADGTPVADGVEDVVDESFVDSLENRTDEMDPVGGTVQDVNGTLENATARPDPADAVENATGEVTNVTGDVADPPGETVGEVEDTADAVEETVDDTADGVNETVDDTTDAADDTTGAVNETVDDTTDTVDDTTDGATDTVDDTTDGATDTVDDTTGAVNETVDDTTDAADDATGGTDDVSNTTDDATDAVDDTTSTVDDTADGTTDAVDNTTDGTTDAVATTTGDATDGVDDANDSVDDTTGDTTDGVDDTTEDATDGVDDTTDGVDDSVETVDDTVETAGDIGGETATSTETEETATSTETVTTATATPDGSDALPDWLEQVDDESAVLATIEVTPGGVDDVENVTTETQHLDDATVDADDNLTRLENGTVLLLNGTDADEIDWPDGDVDGTDATVDDTVETVETTATPDDSDDSVDEATVESDDGTDTTLAWAGV